MSVTDMFLYETMEKKINYDIELCIICSFLLKRLSFIERLYSKWGLRYSIVSVTVS